MGATTALPSAIAPLVIPALDTFVMGQGYPLVDAFGNVAVVATGYTSFDAGPSSSMATSTASTARTGVTFENALAPAQTSPYASVVMKHGDGKTDLDRWAAQAATPDNGLTFYGLARVQRGQAVLTSAEAGSGYSVGPDSYVSHAWYVQYLGWAVHIVFDSTCKRDAYLAKAGDNSLDALFPTNDAKGLSTFLVKSGATIRASAVALGQADALQKVLDGSTCATDKLGDCHALVTSLDGLAKTVGTAPLPTDFSAASGGNHDWFVDQIGVDAKSSVTPPPPAP
jgi:hypothetical protein